jgi:quercetin dioxygenase-like cupin family protein
VSLLSGLAERRSDPASESRDAEQNSPRDRRPYIAVSRRPDNVPGSQKKGGSMQATVTHHRWSDIAAEQINASIARQYITGDTVTIARFELKRGGVVPRHAHENEQVSLVLSGALLFRIDGREVTIRGGEVMQIPGNVAHEVEVLEDSLVIDVFSPIRQDWIEKTDTYFRRT